MEGEAEEEVEEEVEVEVGAKVGAEAAAEAVRQRSCRSWSRDRNRMQPRRGSWRRTCARCSRAGCATTRSE